MQTTTTYLLHFDRPLARGTRARDGRPLTAGHYLGSAADLDARLAEHRAGQGARLTAVIHARGIGFTLARTWDGGRDVERRLKRRKEAPRLCPLCRQVRA